jgi:2-iminobutanoate/2-iminopropanoate deaminase
MSERRAIMAEGAPQAIGPYSHAVVVGNVVYTSGQAGLNRETGKIVEGIEAQTHQTMKNLAAILEAAGSSLKNALKTTVFMVDLKDFQAMNRVYGEYFPGKPPARSTVQVARLPLDALVEIEVVAVLD